VYSQLLFYLIKISVQQGLPLLFSVKKQQLTFFSTNLHVL
jgi:hypothetical protein